MGRCMHLLASLFLFLSWPTAALRYRRRSSSDWASFEGSLMHDAIRTNSHRQQETVYASNGASKILNIGHYSLLYSDSRVYGSVRGTQSSRVADSPYSSLAERAENLKSGGQKLLDEIEARRRLPPTWTDSEVCYGCLAVMQQVQGRLNPEDGGVSVRDIIYQIRTSCNYLYGEAPVFYEPCGQVMHWDATLAEYLRIGMGLEEEGVQVGKKGASGQQDRKAYEHACVSTGLCYASLIPEN